ncbi:MAG: hypothetical protein H7062_15170 [Candidatus Saccharimonas sp.]|nr:hypothetical protein [Planctomycetaceae bacterium]
MFVQALLGMKKLRRGRGKDDHPLGKTKGQAAMDVAGRERFVAMVDSTGAAAIDSA